MTQSAVGPSGQVAGSAASIAQLMAADNDGRSVSHAPAAATAAAHFRSEVCSAASRHRRTSPSCPSARTEGMVPPEAGAVVLAQQRATVGRSTGRRITQEAAACNSSSRRDSTLARLRDDNGFDVYSVISGGPAAKRPTRPTESARLPRADTTYTARRQSTTAAAAAATQPKLVNKFGRTTANCRG